MNAPERGRSLVSVVAAADDARDAERAFVDELLDAVERVEEDLSHEVARMREEGKEDDAHAVEVAMRPLRAIRSGVEPDA